ncbi:MAG TPA: c-type cytochrome [Bryobacteraceae bacterium]|nr:c-type cytochrome [Bryobacteraceae bacterium]
MKSVAWFRWWTIFYGGLALLIAIALGAQPPGAQQPAGGAPGRGGPGRGGRFKIYPADAIARGFTAYNSTCGYCHGERGKGGKAGPDLIASVVTLHDEDGVEILKHVRGEEHSKNAKVSASDNEIADIAAYLHSRVIYASGRGDVRVSEVLVGDASAGERYFNGAGGCNKCHSPSGDLKGVGAKYDVPTLQERLVLPRSGRGATGPNAAYATVTLPSGQKVQGAPLRVTDFDVTLRLADGSTKTWTREHGVPKMEITEPLQAHIDIMTKLSDTDMHNLTAYLATFK